MIQDQQVFDAQVSTFQHHVKAFTEDRRVFEQDKTVFEQDKNHLISAFEQERQSLDAYKVRLAEQQKEIDQQQLQLNIDRQVHRDNLLRTTSQVSPNPHGLMGMQQAPVAVQQPLLRIYPKQSASPSLAQSRIFPPTRTFPKAGMAAPTPFLLPTPRSKKV